jgi:hypothetical protein
MVDEAAQTPDNKPTLQVGYVYPTVRGHWYLVMATLSEHSESRVAFSHEFYGQLISGPKPFEYEEITMTWSADGKQHVHRPRESQYDLIIERGEFFQSFEQLFPSKTPEKEDLIGNDRIKAIVDARVREATETITAVIGKFVTSTVEQISAIADKVEDVSLAFADTRMSAMDERTAGQKLSAAATAEFAESFGGPSHGAWTTMENVPAKETSPLFTEFSDRIKARIAEAGAVSDDDVASVIVGSLGELADSLASDDFQATLSKLGVGKADDQKPVPEVVRPKEESNTELQVGWVYPARNGSLFLIDDKLAPDHIQCHFHGMKFIGYRMRDDEWCENGGLLTWNPKGRFHPDGRDSDYDLIVERGYKRPDREVADQPELDLGLVGEVMVGRTYRARNGSECEIEGELNPSRVETEKVYGYHGNIAPDDDSILISRIPLKWLPTGKVWGTEDEPHPYDLVAEVKHEPSPPTHASVNVDVSYADNICITVPVGVDMSVRLSKTVVGKASPVTIQTVGEEMSSAGDVPLFEVGKTYKTKSVWLARITRLISPDVHVGGGYVGVLVDAQGIRHVRDCEKRWDHLGRVLNDFISFNLVPEAVDVPNNELAVLEVGKTYESPNGRFYKITGAIEPYQFVPKYGTALFMGIEVDREGNVEGPNRAIYVWYPDGKHYEDMIPSPDDLIMVPLEPLDDEESGDSYKIVHRYDSSLTWDIQDGWTAAEETSTFSEKSQKLMALPEDGLWKKIC